MCLGDYLLEMDIMAENIDFTALRDLEANAAREQRGQWRAFVEAIADGEKIPASQIVEELRAFGRTTADLESGIATLQRRRELKATIESNRDTSQEYSSALVEQSAAQKVYTEARSAFEAATTRLQRCEARVTDLALYEHGRRETASRASDELIESSLHPELLASYKAAMKRRGEIFKHRVQAETVVTNLSHHNLRLLSWEQESEKSKAQAAAESYRAQLEALDHEIAEMRQELSVV